MKHDVVVASPRAGITRDKYSANKSRRATPVRPPLGFPLFPLVIYKTSRAGRPLAIFNKSSRVSHRLDGLHRAREGAEGTRGFGGGRCIRSAFYFVPRACALSLCLSLFFSFSFFLRLFYATARFFFFRLFWSTLDCSATTNQDHLTGNTPRTRHLCPRHPRRPSASHFCFPSFPTVLPPPPSPYVHWPICSIKALDWLAWQRGHGSFFQAWNLPW